MNTNSVIKLESLVFSLTFMLLTSCGNQFSNENKNIGKFKNEYTLAENGSFSLNLDENTSSVSLCIQYIHTDSTEILATVNEYMNAINFFDLRSGNKIKSYQFEKEGNNGIGKLEGFLYLNDDSIFVYASAINRLSLVNAKGEKQKSFLLFDSKTVSEFSSLPSPNVVTNSPIRKYKNAIILNGYLTGEGHNDTFENRPTTIMLDLLNDKLSYANGYPSFYHEYNWGGSPTYRSTSYEINDDKIIVSFPASHDLQVFSLGNNSYESYYAGSNKIKKIDSYNKPRLYPLDDNKVFGWYMCNPSYEGIFYDKFNQIYYRVARLPIESYDPNMRYNNKPVIIIILDSSLNYIGEVLLPNKYRHSPYNIFFSEKGLNIQIKDDDEDKMTFVTYKLEKR